MSKRKTRPAPGLRVRIVLDGGAMLGPGKADLLEHIHEAGSIAAAGRRMGMSYKRAWMLVEALNANFAEPLIASSRGGAAHGGATLTATGLEVLERYRRIEQAAGAAASSDLAALRSLARDMSEGK